MTGLGAGFAHCQAPGEQTALHLSKSSRSRGESSTLVSVVNGTLENREQDFGELSRAASPEALEAVSTLPEHQNLKLGLRVDSETASWQLGQCAAADEIERVRPLARTWGGPDRKYRVLERTQDVVLVEVRNDSVVHLGYEVAVIKVLPAQIMPSGKISPRREAYPSSAKNSDDWGTIAWSYADGHLDAARERIERILSARRLPEPEEAEIVIRADGMRLRVLPSALEMNGDIYRVLERQGNVAIYKPDRLEGYEVIVIQTSAPHPRDKRKEQYDLVERFPSNESWGEVGWTYTENAHPQALNWARARMRACLK